MKSGDISLMRATNLTWEGVWDLVVKEMRLDVTNATPVSLRDLVRVEVQFPQMDNITIGKG